MVDIHSHILPKTDDGAATMLEALDMLRAARRNGTKKIVCTPHFYNPRIGYVDKVRTKRIFDDLKEQAKELDIEILLGSEVFCSDLFIEEIGKKEFFTLNGTDRLLIEFDFFDNFDRVLFAIDAVKKAGYVPVVAHPERYAFLMNDEYFVQKLLSEEAILQINTTSLSGKHGEQVADFACLLLEKQYTCAVASDAHDLGFRPTDMKSAFIWVYSHFPKDYAEELFFDNPQAIISGEKIIKRW